MPRNKGQNRKRARFAGALSVIWVLGSISSLALCAGGWAGCAASVEEYTATTFAMDTLITQSAYGPHAEQAMQLVNAALAQQEQRLSLFSDTGDIARINAAAGAAGADVSPETAALLQQALALSAGSDGAFAITIAPLTLAWDITGEYPRVVPQAELDALLPLVDDAAVVVDGTHVTLPQAGMGMDLGGIAKGAACTQARQIYEENEVDSALLSIGGNIFAHGTKPDGTPWRIGFRDPAGGQNAYIASFQLTDQVIAVSGGYERFFEQDGKKYIHILDPRTGCPVQSDIASVGAIASDGTVADFYSTTLYVWGKERTLQYMRSGGAAILLDNAGTLYVSESLREGFMLHEEAGEYPVEFVPGG